MSIGPGTARSVALALILRIANRLAGIYVWMTMEQRQPFGLPRGFPIRAGIDRELSRLR
ncbi:hypothetical protein [Mesorhizobium sp. Root157]|uniref:hypothetical protein n=1 Tax=Mesorhizobium sp. Root157 TaxID=1736477 RepID=UPI0012E3AC69|nr:hypothetical protein [Mesorhizobium sp. Root157]